MQNKTESTLPGKVYTSVSVNNDAGTRIAIKYDDDDNTINIFLNNSYISFPMNTWKELVAMADSVVPVCCKTHN